MKAMSYARVVNIWDSKIVSKTFPAASFDRS